MIQALFPSFVYEAPLTPRGAALIRDIKAESYQIRDFDEAGRLWSEKNYVGGYTSYGSMFHLHRFSSTFESLEKHLDKHVARFVKHLEMDISPRELRLSSCWVNIMPEGVIHTMHIHPLSVISGTYYVQTPPGGGALKFEDPRLASFMASPPRKAKARTENQHFFSVRPKPGQVVLFESWMRHEVPQNRGRGDRISVSFNYDWVGR